jgi:hypothetical protein
MVPLDAIAIALTFALPDRATLVLAVSLTVLSGVVVFALDREVRRQKAGA